MTKLLHSEFPMRTGIHFVHTERIPEWATSFIMLFFGVSLLLPGETMAIKGYGNMAFNNYGDAGIGSIMTLLGVLRIIALYINGNWKRTPLIRMVGAVLGVQMFLAISVSLAIPFLTRDMAPNTAWGTYLVLAVLDTHAVWRASKDARRVYDAGKQQ